MLNSADKETHRVKIGTKMNKHEILAIIELNGSSETKVENRIKIVTGKRQIAAT